MFIKKKWGMLCLIAMSVVLVSTGYVYAGKIKSFSADQVTLAPNGNIENKGNMHVTSDKVRMEMSSPQGKDNMIVIMRRDLNLFWILNSGDKEYFERPLNEDEWKSMVEGATKSKTEKYLGTETINGFKCRKKAVEMVVEVMGFKSKSRSVVWISEKLDMPIRTRMEDGRVTELRNIKQGRQSGKLFEIPGGYKKIENMMGTFAGPDNKKNGERGDLSLPKGLGDKLKGLKLPFGD
jgi:hypothetical protein